MDNHKGFTLLEIMISISIIALIFTSLLKMQASTTELATAIKFDTIAPILAKHILANINTLSKTEGDFGSKFPGIKWNCRIVDSSFQHLKFISQASQSRLKKIEMEIIDSSHQRVYKVTTWRYTGE